MKITQMNRNQTEIKGSKTINLQIDVLKKLKEIQNRMINKDKIPSYSYIINMLIEINKNYHQQLREVEHETGNNKNQN